MNEGAGTCKSKMGRSEAATLRRAEKRQRTAEEQRRIDSAQEAKRMAAFHKLANSSSSQAVEGARSRVRWLGTHCVRRRGANSHEHSHQTCRRRQARPHLVQSSSGKSCEVVSSRSSLWMQHAWQLTQSHQDFVTCVVGLWFQAPSSAPRAVLVF